jgi:hypothetical protein
MELVVSPEWQQIFVDRGQPPIVPAVGSGEVPERVRGGGGDGLEFCFRRGSVMF